ncbi:MAG: hypothetical protein FJ276_06185 [Planctomycetes bacterium]|nr:hypothetical protein [Planctomycetota bacterium]
MTRRYGDTATRRHGDTATRRHGDTVTRRHGDTATRETEIGKGIVDCAVQMMDGITRVVRGERRRFLCVSVTL